MRKFRYLVTLNNEHSAKFSRWNDAVIYGQFYSQRYGGSMVEIRDKTGLLAQFSNGKLTPEFAHVSENVSEEDEGE